MLAYAEAEAENLIRENLNVVLALVDALVESAAGKLTGAEVDSMIESAIACEHLNIEIKRRARWAVVEKSATDFAAAGLGSWCLPKRRPPGDRSHGSRPEEIAIGEANVNLANARLHEAQKEFDRAQALHEGITITRVQIDQAERDARMAEAMLEEVRAKLVLLKVGSREEDITEARARRDAAKARLEEAAARLAYCTVAAPISGVILSIRVSPGQLVSSMARRPWSLWWMIASAAPGPLSLNGISPEFAWANRAKFRSKAFPEINPRVASKI
jgi:hypothetical protein